MNRYFGLLNNVAQEYNIKKGVNESEELWKARIIYSLLGQTGNASLYDVQEDLNPPSIIHFKKRISSLLNSILSMYPETRSIFSDSNECLCNEIYNVMTAAGCIYHKSNSVSPCIRKCSFGKDYVFLRGQSIDEKRHVSGLGCYLPINIFFEKSNCTIEEMFDLSETPLINTWENIVSQAEFHKYTSNQQLEFLRVKPPFKIGYWTDNSDASGKVSLARTVLQGNRIYYLYKKSNSNLQVFQLPDWMTRNNNFRNISAACLAFNQTLPPSLYHIDGSIVTIRIGYLFPPSELNLIKFFSWPTTYTNLPSDFCRIMTLEVFVELKRYLEILGYKFKEN